MRELNFTILTSVSLASRESRYMANLLEIDIILTT